MTFALTAGLMKKFYRVLLSGCALTTILLLYLTRPDQTQVMKLKDNERKEVKNTATSGGLTVPGMSELCGGDSFSCNNQCLDFEAKPRHNCSSVEGFLRLNDQRKQHLENMCQGGGVTYERKLLFKLRHKEILYFKKVGLTWCPSFKAASSNVNAHLCPLYYGDEICKNKSRNGVNMWRKNPEIKRPIRGTKFIVVRDPFRRVLSGYNDKLGNFREKSFVGIMYDSMIVPYRSLPKQLEPIKEKLKMEAKHKSLVRHKTGIEPPLNPDNPYEHPLKATFPELISALLGKVRLLKRFSVLSS